MTVIITDSYGASSSSTSNILVNPEPNEDPYVETDGDQNVTVAHDGNPNTNLANIQLVNISQDPEMDSITSLWNRSTPAEYYDDINYCKLKHIVNGK